MRLGIIGGGQLARMMVPPAHRLGIEVWVLEKTDDCPAKLAGARQVVGDWSKAAVCKAFAQDMDVVTLDHEFCPVANLEIMEEVGKVLPGAEVLRIIADKLEQKRSLTRAGLGVVDSEPCPDLATLKQLGQKWGYPLMLKARHGGYDGKGNVTIASEKEAGSGFGQLSGPVYVEKFLDFQAEVAVMVARDREGRSVAYPVVDTVQENHICRLVRYPSKSLTPELAQEAQEIACKAAEAVRSVGVLGVEMFVTSHGILVNELAPRPHNSGHYTQDSCLTCQFENHVRAVCGLPLGSPEATVKGAVMVNLLGDGHGSGYPHGIERVLEQPTAKLHLYGKAARPGRKLGHLTVIDDGRPDFEEQAENLAQHLSFKEHASL